MKKCANELNRSFSKAEVQMTKNYVKKCSPSLAMKKVQFKTVSKFHLSPIRMAVIKDKKN
jgi:hypothetical protein